ncbi:histidine kinase [Rufibacter sp. DG15C]|uniref:PAS domain-containing sensor histidine kinase n=1 Tax=Rufibacter sp. DG15C TaxID=1379909 RepID=UPI00078CFDF8|nr:PAS domain-containing sensor histidine kinase [Rufibacter sp. DG15C]AMM51587.1 histidine kinase [Rufibacter sp. DG15C]
MATTSSDNTALVQAIIQNAIDGIITIDDRGMIESINPAASDLFGYSSIEVIGKNISMLMPSPDKERHDQYLSRYQETRVPHMIGIGREVKGLKKDGVVFPFRLALSEVQLAGRIIYTGFIHDLSREKEAEEKLREHYVELEAQVKERTQSLQHSLKELQNAKDTVSTSLQKEKDLSQLKSRFVSMASHEFRTPLSSVQLSASLIERYALSENPNITKHVNKIKSAVTNLTNILNDFLLHERLDAGKVEPTFTLFNVVRLGEEITEEMQLVSKDGQDIIYQHTGVESEFRLDQYLLKNCIINLISNAIKYSGENTFIEFNTEIQENVLTVVIKDYGIGIPEKDHAQLFEPFFRAHNTGTIPGTGLGLHIVRRYVMLMNGSITFESNLDKGTSVTFTFPVQP